jgi:hypothetical protein
MRKRLGLAIASLMIAATAGCIDASRVNDTCTWNDSPPRQLDMSRADDRDHLRLDARVAGELGLRFADLHYRHVPRLNAPLLASCRTAMWDSIRSRHGVSQADIDRAVVARVWWVDLTTVYIPMALITVVLSNLLTRRVRAWFAPDHRTAAGLATCLFVIIAAGLALGITQVWSMFVETSLLRNGHLGFRVGHIPIMLHGWIGLMATGTIASGVAIIRSRAVPLSGASGAGGWKPAYARARRG